MALGLGGMCIYVCFASLFWIQLGLIGIHFLSCYFQIYLCRFVLIPYLRHYLHVMH